MKKKVLVAMSGGVDSSVASLLLKEKGYEVVGVTMCLGIKEGDGEKPRCCGVQAIEDAKRVCRKLGIPHYVLDFSRELEKRVVNNFISEYLKGRTPNPCIDCNRYIKFRSLLSKALAMGFDFLATGHYAKVEFDNKRSKYLLRRGVDFCKDQSYWLYVLTQKQLRHTLMPLGNFTKSQVRKIASQRDLPVADKLESQEICFIPDNNYGRFLQKYIHTEAKPGSIINTEGKIIGKHRGIIFYTIGQRKGIGIADKEPLYVIAIDKEHNTIVVGKKTEACSRELIADNVNFIIERLKTPFRAKVKIRYLHPFSLATVIPLSRNRLKVKFDRRQWAITPGQAVVFYLSNGRHSNGDIVIGGGTIASGKS